jgi:galactokinase
MKKELIQNTKTHFKENFNTYPDHFFLSPGRINIIGEHIDYNDGYVLPAAINKYICLAVSKNNSNLCNIISNDLNESYQINLNDECKPIDKMWLNYILGVINQLKERNLEISGINLVFKSTIPIGSGLSSSAALSCGITYLFNKLFDLKLTKKEIAFIGQKSEHTFVGVNCGIMDQFACVFSKKNQVIKLDCNTLEIQYYKTILKNHSLLLLNSNKKHSLVTSGYNTRRTEVEQGLVIIKERFNEVKTFRNCSIDMVNELKDVLGQTMFKRCSYVVKELKRVEDAVYSIENSNLSKLGALMYETHVGLSEEYEVSCEELDFLVNEVKSKKSVLGSRMMGGGFGGCTLNLIKKGKEEEIISNISKKYFNTFGIELSAYKVKLSNGVSEYKKFKYDFI